MSLILQERRDAVEIIQLNRPDKFNALSREMILTLSDRFSKLTNDADLRAIILTGAGDQAFCAGTDIAELHDLDEEEALAVSQRGQALCDLVENCRVPVIAAINGVAAGGGCELALACHLRLGSEHAQFSLPETKLGVIPAYGGTARLAREIGSGRALEIMLTGRTLNAEEALHTGLLNQVVEAGRLIAEAEELARQIASLAPLAIRACLEAVNRGADLPLAQALELESKLFAGLFRSEDVHEGTSAFLQKRQPVFKGK